MRGKAENAEQQGERESVSKLRYPKPRIMLIDVAEDVQPGLEDLGYNVTSGTFGHPYEVQPVDQLVSVHTDWTLPGYQEQEIVIVDLSPPPVRSGPPGDSPLDERSAELYTNASCGTVDPRPVGMHLTRADFDRIMGHSGCFVVFAAPRVEEKYVLLAKGLYGFDPRREEVACDNWAFLSTLSSGHLTVTGRFGTEITVLSPEAPICGALSKCLGDCSYWCTLGRNYGLGAEEWYPLAVDKYGDTVAACVFPGGARGGFAVVLPQVADKAGFLARLLGEDLPELAPALFPYVEGGRWVERPEYELPTVAQLKQKKVLIGKRIEKQLAELDSAIEKERAEMGFLHDILGKTGDDLVQAVERCLKFVGFEKVVNVDQLLAGEGGEPPRQEDLQILDQSPSLVIEIKGLAGVPTEADSFQVVKYVNRRMKEWDRTDVQGLSIVNHQRNVPALERNHERAFTQQQVDDAEQSGSGLLTTWELFLLVRGMVDGGWDPVHVRSLLYRTGRIGRAPAHYQPVGFVFNYWSKVGAVGIDVQGAPLRLGDRVGFVLPGGFAEQTAESLELDGAAIELAELGQKVGLKTTLGRDLLHKGTLVCVVKQESEEAA